jgi:DNA-binding transcriptional LysR family regulator
MDLTDLRLLQDVARAGSLAAVARARDLDPSAISRAVSAIEERLGLRVFERTTRRLALTEGGEAYLARALPLAEELARVTAEAGQANATPTGTLRLTASVTFGQRVIVPLLPAFRARNPDVAIEGVFTDAVLDLVAERIDLAIRLAPAIEGDVIAARLVGTQYRIVAAPRYLAAAPPLDRPEDLSAHRVLRFTLRDFRHRWRFRDTAGTMTEVPVSGDVTLSPAGALREAAIAGLGPALLPGWLIDRDVRAGRLVRCLPGWEVTATSFDTAAWAVYPSRPFLPAKVRAMIDFLRANLSADPERALPRGRRAV